MALLRHHYAVLALPLCLGLHRPASALPPGFYPLGYMAGGQPYSHGHALSADGSVAVGIGYSALGPEAFRWTAETGMVGIGDLPGGGVSSSARGVSADGSVIVGNGSTPGERSFRWTAATGMMEIAPAGGARSVSADGSVVVGNSNFQAYRWTQSEGAVGLGHLPGGYDSLGFDVSADGSVVVGNSTSATSTEAFRWTAETGMVGLGDLPGGPVHSEARGVSADGSVVVGFSDSAAGRDAFRWTPETGMVNLGAGTSTFYSADVSADGSVILLAGFGGVLMWDEVHGLRSVSNMLGVSFSDWRFIRPEGISDDGTTLIGWGRHFDDNEEAWIAVLPEPSTLALLAIGGLMLAGRSRE